MNEPVKEPLGPTARRAGTILARTRLIQEGALAPTTIQQPAEAEVIGAPVEFSWRGCCAKPYSAK